ncbi:MAG TPA: PilZ domain-containing protein [Spirochaetia bacterium]|nr:PilZ domain-containing protein [Spirochaetia bacterium]
MIVRVLEVLGRDRAFELFEYLILFFVLTSLATLIAVLAHQFKLRKVLRLSNSRLEKIVRHLGLSLYGESGWQKVEETAAANGHRLDSLLSLLTQPPDLSPSTGAGWSFSEVVPTSGMPVAVRQGGVHARGTIAEVGENAFAIWLLDDDAQFDEGEPVTVLLLSRSGPYTFEASLRTDDDGTVIVERPERIVRTQRRRFERRPASLPATVHEYLDGESRSTETTISELSGGGATLVNPNHEFAVGNVLTMSFFAGTQHYTVAGRVVRSSADESRLHVRFEAMKDQQREDIARSLRRVDLG